MNPVRERGAEQRPRGSGGPTQLFEQPEETAVPVLLHVVHGDEPHRGGVHTISEDAWRGAVIEYMTQVGSRTGSSLQPSHPTASGRSSSREHAGRSVSVKLGQPVPELNLSVELNRGSPETTSDINPGPLVLNRTHCRRPLGAFLLRHLELQGRQLFLQLLVRGLSRTRSTRSSPRLLDVGVPPRAGPVRVILAGIRFGSSAGDGPRRGRTMEPDDLRTTGPRNTPDFSRNCFVASAMILCASVW